MEFKEIDKRVNELEAEVDLLRNSTDLNLQEIKWTVRLDMLEEFKAREVGLDDKQKTIDALMKELMAGTAKLVVNQGESLTSRTLNALQTLGTEMILLRTFQPKPAIKGPPQKSSKAPIV